MNRHENVMVVAAPVSSAAVSYFDLGPPVGECWRIIAARANHDDPAAHDLEILVLQGAVTFQVSFNSAVAQYVPKMLYAGGVLVEPLILKYGDYLRINFPVVLAAGKKAYWGVIYEKLLGVCT